MKKKTTFFCQSCGGESPKWQGQCPHCADWNTLIEAPSTKKNASSSQSYTGYTGQTTEVLLLNDVEMGDVLRTPTGLEEFDRVLGGGLVCGSVVLIGGDPGIGKSTLLLQTLSLMAQSQSVLYVTGEESPQQVAMRAKRLQLNMHMHVLAAVELENILHTIEQSQAKVIVIDSIQTMYSQQIDSIPGSVSQVKECAAQLTRLAKTKQLSIILVGHVTKEGNLAGPRVLEHMVDTVLYFEGDNQSSFRLIRAFKNRFGAVNELGIFSMTDKGLKEVNNPSALFLSQIHQKVSGSCIMVTQEGTRPLLVEIQALVDKTHLPNPKRLALGLDQNRLAMLLAVMHKHAKVFCYDQDVFLNVVGGVKINEPAADMAIISAIYASLHNCIIPRNMVIFGELGLNGEVRPAPKGQERLKEAAKLGFEVAIIPKSNFTAQSAKQTGLKLHAIEHVKELVDLLNKLSG